MLVTDSLPFGNDHDETQMLCSPGSIMATDVAAKTVLEVHVRENAMKAAVEQDDKVGTSPHTHICVYMYIWTNVCAI